MSVLSAQSGASQQAEAPLLPCDLVMKGGITSGIVYPPAILQLKENYKFQSIGGTSAGAIAAAGIAAAEFNRNNGGGDAGFAYLEEHVQRWLSADSNLRNLFQASADSNLRNLFKPSPATKPLMDFALAFLKTPPAASRSGAQRKPSPFQPIFKLLRVWLFNYLPISSGAVWGAIIGTILFISLPLATFALLYLISASGAAQSVRGFTIAEVILGLLGAWLGWHVGGVISAIIKLPGNFYGICTGHSTLSDGTPDYTNLTDWMSKVLDELAGDAHTVPLTFEDLNGKNEDLNDKKIQLKMVTSNLSHGLPYVMPEGLHNFIFKKSDMLKLFPEYVVQYMIEQNANPERKPLIPRDKLPELPENDGYYYLPDEKKLPVVVCTRMSLSFPILLSAVPLYTISTRAYNDFRDGKIAKLEEDAKHLQLNWFSDGGICSNFPIQFFDAWLPKRPTFGINLTNLSSADATSALQECGEAVKSAAMVARNESDEPVYLPKAEDRQDPEWGSVNGLLSFARAIFGTAQSYRDTMQANLPSYRERIVQIRLDETEGGLNLAMPKEIIEKIVQKGQKAGATLCDPAEFNLDHHIWVRFLVLMAQLEQNVVSMQEVLKSPDFDNLLEQKIQNSVDQQNRYPYSKEASWSKDAALRVAVLRNLIKEWNIPPMDEKQKPCFFCKDAPLPQPVLRVTPEL
jgi:predicted acylesterase/phospholipase RssA